MRFICYPACSTCKRAQTWLDDHKIAYTARHIQTDNPSYEELSAWLKKSDLPLKRFFNTSGLHYKALSLKEKLPHMTEEEQLRLLATDGMLVKRPILTDDRFVLVGFDEKKWEETLCATKE